MDLLNSVASAGYVPSFKYFQMYMISRWLHRRAGRTSKQYSSQELGKKGERIAARRLQRMGYSILARNTIIRGVEIDLVCYDYASNEIVLVEVKTRRYQSGPTTRVHPRQSRRIARAAKSLGFSWNVRVEHLEVRINQEDSG